MAAPRLRVPNAPPPGAGPRARTAQQVSDEVELYHRTYTTLLRSSGETLLRVLEPSHRSMTSSLHALAGSEELDLGAFLYAIRRLPDAVSGARVIVMGQEAEVFARHGIGPLDDWTPLEAPARRRRWYDDENGTMAVLLASASDLDDLIPTLVAYQIEWNKLRLRLRSADWPPDVDELDAAECAAVLGGVEDDWSQLLETWGDAFLPRLQSMAAQRLNLRVRMLGGSSVGYARMTRHWWAPVRATLAEQALDDRPMYFVSSNPHSMVNLLSGTARRREDEVTAWVESEGPDDLRVELAAFRDGRTDGSWENFLYFSARDFFEARPAALREARSVEERAVGITHISSRTALRVSAQVIALDSLDPALLDPRLGDLDAERLSRSPAVIVNIEYPLGLAAYNILREITEAHDTLARRLHPRQGRDAQRRRRRRDDLLGHPRRALGLDVLARQRVLRQRHRPVPHVRVGPGQPARGDGQVDVPAEPRVPRLLLPRGVHRRGDGGGALLQRGVRDRGRRPLPRRRGRRTSPSSRSTSGSSTTPPTRRTRRRARSARAG